MQILRFFVLNGRINVLLEFVDDLEALVETCDGAHDAAVRPHHILELFLALAPVGGFREADAFFLGFGNA